MIKYIQKLKAKKGFTLVELIVVIAIIGVLAAILIPTMLGYVTQSKVTSANSTAASIKNEIDAFLTSCDTNGYGMKKGNSAVAALGFIITNNGSWEVQLSDGNTAGSFNNGSGSWAAVSGVLATDSKSASNHLKGLTADLAQLFPEIKAGYITANLCGGKCIGVTYQNEEGVKATNGVQKLCYADSHMTQWPTGYGWDADTLGIDHTGHIVGTAPVLQLADKATKSNQLSS